MAHLNLIIRYWSLVLRKTGPSLQSGQLIVSILALIVAGAFSVGLNFTPLPTWAAISVAIGILFFVITPTRIWIEDQKKISTLEPGGFPDVEIRPTSVTANRAGTHDDPTIDSWLLLIHELRITNRATTGVSLGFRLHIVLKDEQASLWVDEDPSLLVRQRQMLLKGQTLLNSPVNVEPAKSKMGNLAFLVPPLIAIVGHKFEFTGNFSDVIDIDQLQITDYVSNQKIRVQPLFGYP